MSRRKKKRNQHSKKVFSNKKPLLELLEQKQLLDAGGFSEIVQATSLSNDPIEVEISDQVDESALNAVVSESVRNATAESSQIIFIDAGVEDYESMLSEFPSGAEVILLEADRDGVEQISNTLASRSDISAIHIISHGNEGEVNLGNTVLTSENLSEYADQLAGWSGALTEDADLLFYGCDLAGNAEGEQFIESISAITGADVAASDDLTLSLIHI